MSANFNDGGGGKGCTQIFEIFWQGEITQWILPNLANLARSTPIGPLTKRSTGDCPCYSELSLNIYILIQKAYLSKTQDYFIIVLKLTKHQSL